MVVQESPCSGYDRWLLGTCSYTPGARSLTCSQGSFRPMMLFSSPLQGPGVGVGSPQLHCLRPLTASLAEGPTTATAVPAAGGGSARGLRLPPPPPLGPPLRNPGSQEAPPVGGHLQPEPAGGGWSPAGDGQRPQGAARGETHLGPPGCSSSPCEGLDFYLETQGGHFWEPAGKWLAPF